MHQAVRPRGLGGGQLHNQPEVGSHHDLGDDRGDRAAHGLVLRVPPQEASGPKQQDVIENDQEDYQNSFDAEPGEVHLVEGDAEVQAAAAPRGRRLGGVRLVAPCVATAKAVASLAKLLVNFDY